MKKRLIIAGAISVLILWHASPWVKAADQTTVLLVAIQSNLTSLTASVTSLRDEVRNDRSSMLKRTNDLDQKFTDLSNRVDDLDTAHQNQQVIGLAARTSIIETKLDDAKRDRDKAAADAKADHDSLMSWVRPTLLTLIGTLISTLVMLLTAHFRGRKAQTDSERVEKKADAAYEEANNYARREKKIDAGQHAQDDRLDALERPDIEL